MSRLRLAWCALALALLSVACTGEATAVLPPAPPVVHLSLDEYSITVEESTVPPGRVLFFVTNEGSVEHRVALIPLPEDFPPLKEQLQSPQHRFVEELAAGPNTPPGEQARFAVDLDPDQRYALVCFETAPDGELHAVKGEALEFRTTRRAPVSPTPPPGTPTAQGGGGRGGPTGSTTSAPTPTAPSG